MKKYICVFCDERKDSGTAYLTYDNIGICKECYEALSKTSPSLPYPGVRNISYIMSPFEYTGSMRQVILDYKFKNQYAYAPLLAGMMREYLLSYDIWEDFDYIIPVPLHKTRLKERGYNQSELIAQHISEYIHVPMRTDILHRIRATERQSSLQRLDRITNVQGAFECSEDVSGKKIILFDDICTTGSTLRECALPLHEAGAEVICALTLAIHMQQKLPVITY